MRCKLASSLALGLLVVACSSAPSGDGASGANGGNSNSSGKGGSDSSGGKAGSGGSGEDGSGGSAGSGSGGTSGGAMGGGSGNTPSDCATDIMGTLSPKIGTVGIVTFSTSMKDVTEANIDFGLDTKYGFTAPVDLKADKYRTLMLGMKAAKMYHYRLRVKNSQGECMSGDNTIMTGPPVNGVPTIKVTTTDATKLSGGFVLTGVYGDGNGAYILDADADTVWFAGASVPQAASARMSYDGKYMWVSGVNCCTPNNKGNVHRISMDGTMDEDLGKQFPGQNHQLTVLPDETVAFYAYNLSAMGACDDIFERSPDGKTKLIVNSGMAQGVTTGCHLNTIQYSEMDNTYVFSDLDHNSIVKIDRTGKTIWVLNGTDGVMGTVGTGLWAGHQHGIHVIEANHILMFNNNQGMGSSQVFEWIIDPMAKMTMKKWQYVPSPAIMVSVMGDVQRMSNGNTMVAFSDKAILQEVSSDGKALQSWSWPLGGGIGFIEKRLSLYGKPGK